MKLDQSYIPKEPYCVICGEETKDETCSDICKDKLEFLRSTVKQRIKDEKDGVKQYNEKTIIQFNKLQDYIK